jgi:hypothetical protein
MMHLTLLDELRHTPLQLVVLLLQELDLNVLMRDELLVVAQLGLQRHGVEGATAVQAPVQSLDLSVTVFNL